MSSGRERAHSPLMRREAGILLHPTSLPGPWGTGDLGAEAHRFVDFIAAAGQHVWQILPLGPPHGDGSPYQCNSVHAGNPLLISIEGLAEQGWIDGDISPGPDWTEKQAYLARAYEGFKARAGEEAHQAFEQFVADNEHWLPDFSLYRVIKAENQGRPWTEWGTAERDRDPAALQRVHQRHAEDLERIRFEQFIFHSQWLELKHHANAQDVRIFGDLPIFVAHDSADVWAQREYFLLGPDGQPTVVAGVPPDYFSETGQRWGNPHYDWERMQADGFQWWQARLRRQLELFDLVRIDHFRGFEAYWEVPAEEETAMNGRWVEAPGDALFEALHERFDPLPIVAEDLGTISAEVRALRRKYALPGMKILQFAFDSDAKNPYLPHNHRRNSVVYTGTHDNDTTLGWYEGLTEQTQARMQEYLGYPQEPPPWPLIRAAYASVARLAVVPLQDVLALGSEQRMNRPGTTEGNWDWRFGWEQVPEDLAERLHQMMVLYGRTHRRR